MHAMKRTERISCRAAALAAVCIVLVAGLPGCGKSGPAEISGTVTFNGTPVDMGTVEFIPADRKGQIAVGTIEAGKYSAQVAPGPKNVVVEIQKKLGERRYRPGDANTPLVPVTQPLGRKEFTREVTEGETTVDFQLP